MLLLYVVCAALDLFLLFGAIYAQATVLVRLQPYLDNALQITQQATDRAVEQDLSNLDQLLANDPSFMNNYRVITTGIIVVLAVLFLLWVISQTIIWVLVHRFARTKKKMQTILWQVVGEFVVAAALVLVAGMILGNSMSVLPLYTIAVAWIINSILFAVWHYAATALNTAVTLQQVLSARRIALPWLITTLIKVVLVFNVLFFAQRWLVVGIVFGIGIALPFWTYTRIRLVQSYGRRVQIS